MKIIVIGSGLLGVTSAYFLAKDGHEVTVFDRNDEVARSTSYANAGMLTPSMADPWNAPGVLGQLLRYLGREDAPLLLRLSALPGMVGWGLAFLANSRPEKFKANMRANLQLSIYSLAVMRELRETLGLSYDQITRGTLKIFRDEKALAAATRRFDALARMGLQVRTLGRNEVVALEPALADVRDTIVGGIHCPQDESGDARRFTQELAQKARDAGVKFGFGAAVTGFERDGQRISAVMSGQQRHTADAFVVAAGSWSALLLKYLGISLPIRPVKGYSITVHMDAWTTPPQLPVVDDALHIAATPMGNRLRVAGTAEFAGYDNKLTPSRVENLFDLLLSTFPSFKPHLDRQQSSPWTGFRPVSSDGVPWIGRLKFENLYANTGHGHLGWTLAAGSSRLLADLIRGGRGDVDHAPYDAERL